MGKGFDPQPPKINETKEMREKFQDKAISILITAALSAAIALLQALLTHYLNPSVPTASPEVAGGIGLALRTGYYLMREPVV